MCLRHKAYVSDAKDEVKEALITLTEIPDKIADRREVILLREFNE